MECKVCGENELVKTLVEWSNRNGHGFYVCYECVDCGERFDIIELDDIKRINELRKEMGFKEIGFEKGE